MPADAQAVPGQEPPVTVPPVSDGAQIKAMEVEMRKMSGTIENLQRQVVTAPPAPRPVAPQPMDPQALKQEFFKDPVGYTLAISQRAAMEAAAQGTAGSFDTLVGVAREQARATDPELFDAFAMEIETMVNTQVQPQFRTNTHVWKNAFNQVKGNNVDKVLEIRGQRRSGEGNQAPAVHISREGGPSTSSPRRPDPPPAKTVTAEESHIAAKLGITKEQYIKGKADYDGQNEKGPSSWDPFLTTSSRDKRRAARAAATAKK